MNTFKYTAAIALTLCISFLTGCFSRSQPAQNYTLSAMQRPEASPLALSASRFTVSVGPVIVPDSLKRPQIAIRTNDNQVSYSEFHKWAGLLKDDIKRILAENIGILLAGEGGTVSTDDLLIEPDYRVVINISRFDGMPEENTCLNAVWTLKDRQHQKTIAVRQSVFTEKVDGPGYSDLVSAQSRTLALLSTEIAAEIKKQCNAS